MAGWEGPVCLTDGVYRYSRCISWIRLYIDLEGMDFYGGISGACDCFEVEREGGAWKRFQTDLAKTPAGEPVLRLRGYSTWDVVYDRVGEGVAIDEAIGTIEDLAAYLEKCLPT